MERSEDGKIKYNKDLRLRAFRTFKQLWADSGFAQESSTSVWKSRKLHVRGTADLRARLLVCVYFFLFT